MDDIERAYSADDIPVEHILGVEVSPYDPDRAIIEPWADTLNGPILDVGSGTGRWTGHLTQLGYEAVGLEPAERLIGIARETHPNVNFWHGSIDKLDSTETRWAGILAWYSIIHMGPAELPNALAKMRSVLQPHGSMLLSFFSGRQRQPIAHPVATAYLWPMADILELLTEAGFDVETHHWDPSVPHAYLIARPT